MASISHFYEQVLGAHLSNTRWSWGAVDRENNRIYLRVWRDEFETYDEGERVVVLLDVPRTSSPGYKERKNHLAQIKNGAEGFGVVCTAVDTKTKGARTIASFDDRLLVRLGAESRDHGRMFLRVESWVPVASLSHQQTSQSTLIEDLQQIARRKVDATTRERLGSARVGQGQFRTDVLKLWGGRCAVTGTRVLVVVRASHIKPWRHSTDEERLDPENGLPLAAHLDALFDAGWITFGSDGTLLVSPRLDPAETLLFELNEKRLVKPPTPKMAGFLKHHTESVFRRG
jgi:putative restriction endonuclease